MRLRASLAALSVLALGLFRTLLQAADLIAELEAAEKPIKLLWVVCGNKDNLLGSSPGVHAYLKEKGIPHVWHVDVHAHDPTE